MTATTRRTLAVRNIAKSFAATKALKGVSIAFEPGTVHVLIGENGAGKSTLLKIVSGLYPPDSGEILLDGKPVRFSSPHEARAARIAMVFQELTLLPDMTVMDNLFLGAEQAGVGGLLRRAEMRRIFKEKSRKYGLDLPADEVVRNLPLSRQQLVEALKALMGDPEIIIFDEATSALDNAEVEILFSIIASLKNEGRTVIFISHRMEEIFTVGDRVSVLKDGDLVTTRDITELDQNRLIEFMVGRSISDIFPPKAARLGEVLFEAKGLGKAGKLDNINLQARRGEIVGIAGLQGQGQATLLACLAGIEKYDAGEVLLHGNRLPQAGPRQAIRNGVILVPEDRKTQALFLEHSVHINLSLSSQYKRQAFGFVNVAEDEAFVNRAIGDLSIKTHSPENQVGSLSGGNQQKVVLGRALGVEPQVILFNEPTRGVDVQTKQEFYRRMRALAEAGICIILYSSDLLEVIGVSDTVHTMYEGRITSVLSGDGISEVGIMRGAVGITEAAP
ncbi:MAG: sugar ABC transporter ATP-binding protein [Planctomycetes bacterium]|nr:sugar ABC transporter ATP-binding protein [Planctomycetota bacterium]